MQGFEKPRASLWGAALLMSMVIAGCASNTGPAPVEDRGTMGGAPVATSAAGDMPAPVKPPPGIENLGKPGYYEVRPGDTVRKIARDTSQKWQDIVRWNNLDGNPDRIEVGQVLRVVPPVATAAAPAPAPAAASPAAAAAPAPTEVAKPSAPVATASVASPASASGDENVGWIWPAQGSLLAGFDEAKNKGYDIGGKAGDPVVAAADGQVVYAGAGLRGYGNLIILKHNNTYLTAYAHNRSLLVKEDQRVRRGQQIAEMGNSDADRVKLHFEIRRQGKPVDPSRYLPSR
ncbi:peptidoglycan DD-metalloendopeptidase family protein [Xenophilus arseniciresistens]|uniref:Peptidoglycan DD-metalloendopeptidase family protein n=1 Tax=Xenophilus arseniciresistens TaxID=1283306 RepID=A0AAE3N5L4_9BURK|nr:peptidoglycan DD-metalloendopeptidase family protein [Xenophilus arseniciresistens]MDA7416325.1 peptidoglycan DD-metalloendopeptidase family protein [Xenophilus arseniciresistens]